MHHAMTETPMIRTPFVRALLSVLRAAGANAEELIDELALPADVERVPVVVVPLRVLHELSDRAAIRIGDPLLGLHLARAIDPGQFGVLEFVLRSAATLRQACGLAARYAALIHDLDEIRFEERADEAILEDRIPGEPLCGGRQVNEFLLAMIVRNIRQLCRQDWAPRRIWLAHPRHHDAPELEAFFAAPVSFAAGTNGVAFELADLDLPLRTADAPLLAVLESGAHDALAAMPAPDRTLGRVREHIRRVLPHGLPRLAPIASAVAMSPRALQRRLADAGTSFRDLIDDVQAALSKLYLADRKLALGDVAMMLGFSDLRAFVRAFRRWTALTPAQFRGQQS